MGSNRHRAATYGLGLLMGFAGLACAADESAEAAAAMGKAPAAVKEAATKALGGKKCEEFDSSMLDGKQVYEAGWKEGSTDHSALISADGKLIQTEADVDLDKLPAAVTAAVKKAEPTGKLDEAALAQGDGQEYYSVDVKVAKAVHVVNVKADGTVLGDLVEKPIKTDAADKAD